ncbi:MAG: hypothetical protein ACTHYR_10695 [Brachybacterium sp.]
MIYTDPDTGFYTADAPVTAAEMFDFICRVGRAEGPAALSDLDAAGLLDEDTLAAVLPMIWSWAESPAQAVDQDTWAAWFEQVGYRDAAGDVLPRPERLRLYRGCSPDEADDGWGMSWTDDVDTARRFARRNRGQVFTAVVPGWLLLADLTNDPRSEREFIVSGMELEAVELLDMEVAA